MSLSLACCEHFYHVSQIGQWHCLGQTIHAIQHEYIALYQEALFITKPKAKSGNYQRERPMLHMLKLKSPENAR